MKNLFADRANFGGTVTAQTAPLRLGALGARAAGAVLSVNASGDVTSGALQVADIPSVFTRRDVAETISQPWNPTGLPWTFSPGASGAAPPDNTPTGGVGTRIIYYPAAGYPFSVGMQDFTLWHCVPTGNWYRWYQGAQIALDVTDTGKVRVPKSGILELVNGAGFGEIAGQSGITMNMPTGAWNWNCPDVWPSTNYQTNLGHLTKKYLTLHAAELWVETLVAQDTLATIGGRVLVGPTTELTSDMPVSGIDGNGEQNAHVKHNNIAVGDFVVLEAAGKFEIMLVVATASSPPPGPYYYRFRRNQDGSGASDWYAGDAMFNTGQYTGNYLSGFIDLYSLRGVGDKVYASAYGPTIVGNVRVNNNPIGWEPRWAIGNLKGIYANAADVCGVAFGKSSSGIHLQIDEANGVMFLDQSNNKWGQWDMVGAITLGYGGYPNVLINSGGIQLRNGGTTTMQLEGSTGNLKLLGNIAGGGATAFNSGIGYWLSGASNTQLRVGNPTGNKVEWDGTNLRLVTPTFEVLPGTGVRVTATPGGGAGTGGYVAGYGYGFGPNTYNGNATLFTREEWGSLGPMRELWITNDAPGDANISTRISLGCGATLPSSAAILSVSSYGRGQLGVKESEVTIRSEVTYMNGALMPCTAAGAIADSSGWIGMPHARFQWSVIAWGIGVGITVQPAYQIHLGADLAGKPGTSTWTVISDAGAKRDVRPIDGADALRRVRAVEVVDYTYNGAHGTPEGYQGIGVIAQDVQAVLPRSVRQRDDGVYDWNAHELWMLNVVAVQELAARVAALEQKG
jgi:hypothetical protein